MTSFCSRLAGAIFAFSLIVVFGGSIDGVDQDNMANTLRMGGGMECVRGAAPMWG
ncbi:MAG TPA: hypothetical protein VIJ63_18225 [Roseiarcus sp.]